jgi:hypothetical protein
MRRFRMLFRGVSIDAELHAEFDSSVKRAAITVRSRENIIWRPSLYFSLPPSVHERPAAWFQITVHMRSVFIRMQTVGIPIRNVFVT